MSETDLRRAAVFGLGALALLALGNFLIGRFGAAPPGLGWPFLDHWKLVQYQFSYAEFGLIKRALPGAIFGFSPTGGVTAGLLALACLPALILTLTLALGLARLKDRGLAAALLLSPALFVQFGFDLGRFDQLNYVLLLIAVFVPSRWAILLLPVMPFVHEGALFIHIPLAAMLHVHRHGWGAPLWAASVLSIAAVLALVFAGARPSVEAAALAYPQAYEDALEVITSDPVTWLQSGAWRMIALLEDHAAAALLGVGAAYGLVLLWAAGHLLGRSRDAILLILACLCPLLLALLGVDYPRWMALAATNLVIAILFAARPGAAPLPRAVPLVLGLFALAGPFGIFEPFPVVAHLVQAAVGAGE